MVYPDISPWDGARIYAFRAYLTNVRGEQISEAIETFEYGSVHHAKVAAVDALADLSKARAA